MTEVAAVESLTKTQTARRGRVTRAALELGAEGGYDAVQMRAVSSRADVALGTIYRYFSSKDHLLAVVHIDWILDLEKQVANRPPEGASAADRMVDILDRAIRSQQSEPKLTEAVTRALTSDDRNVADCQAEMNDVMTRVQQRAFEPGFDGDRAAGISRVLEHIWFSALLGWVNGWTSIDTVGDELASAAHLLLDQYD